VRYKENKAKQKKLKKCTFIQKSIQCAQRKYEKVNIHKKEAVTEF